MDGTDAAILLAAILLPALYAAWSDLATMTIPNGVHLLLLAIFLVLGPILLPIGTFGGQLALALGVLAAGFLLNSIGALGGGDAKMAAAVTLFVAWTDLGAFLQILAMTSLAGLVTHRAIGRIAAVRGLAGGWASWSDSGRFPLGFALAGALIFYLAVLVRTLSGAG